MKKQDQSRSRRLNLNRNIYKIGFWAGMAAFASNAAFVLAQTLQLLRVLKYPFDEIFIYGFSLCIVIPFLLEMLALHHVAPEDKKYWSHAGLVFTVIYSVFVTANYVVQLATVIPATLKGASDKVAVLVQSPHSMFWILTPSDIFPWGWPCCWCFRFLRKRAFSGG
jgi:hypothetical protein